MSETSTTADTWAPDWEALQDTATTFMYGYSYANDDEYLAHKYAAIWEEIQRQAAAAGLVMVRREDLETLLTYWGFFPPETLPQEIQLATTGLIAALAATPEPAPGGDGA